MEKALQVLIGILMAAGGVLIAAAVQIATTDSGNGNGWAVAGSGCWVVALLVFVLYYLVHPGLRKAAYLRRQTLAKYPADEDDPPPDLPPEPQQATVSAGGVISIVQAMYGVSGAGIVDVTAIVKAHAKNGVLNMSVSNEVLRVDPCPDIGPKTLWVRYTVDDAAKEARFMEDTRAVLP